MIAHGLSAASVLAWRELVGVTRRPSRVIASIGTPALVWALFAGGLGALTLPGADADPGMGAVVLPGVLTMVVLFGSLFAAMSLIEDRASGLLQAALTSPAPRWSIALGKIAGGSVICLVQAALLLPAAWGVGLQPGPLGVLVSLALLALVAIGIGGVCLASAWWIDSSAGFHGVMNLLLMPLWLLSGGLFARASSAPWMDALITINPLAWPTEALRLALAGENPSAWLWAGSVAFAALGGALAWSTVGRVALRH